ncbi:hypothetical protein HDU97_008884, partial [Phlyctochytrium planicorne]
MKLLSIISFFGLLTTTAFAINAAEIQKVEQILQQAIDVLEGKNVGGDGGNGGNSGNGGAANLTKQPKAVYLNLNDPAGNAVLAVPIKADGTLDAKKARKNPTDGIGGIGQTVDA